MYFINVLQNSGIYCQITYIVMYSCHIAPLWCFVLPVANMGFNHL